MTCPVCRDERTIQRTTKRTTAEVPIHEYVDGVLTVCGMTDVETVAGGVDACKRCTVNSEIQYDMVKEERIRAELESVR